MRDLNIIIVNFNGKALLERLLPSLKSFYLDQCVFDVGVVVVDNASSDDSVSFLSTLPYIDLVQSTTNGGFSYGNNLGIRNFPARNYFLLNSDTEFLAEVSNPDVLLSYLKEHPKTAVVTPKVLLADGKLDEACHRGEPSPWAAFCYLSGLEKWLGKFSLFGKYHLKHLNLNEIHTIDACSGAAMMVRGEAVEKVGLLDERFFMYAEDLDWCKRFRDTGWDIVYHPQVEIIHHKYASGLGHQQVKQQTTSQYYFYQTMLQYLDKHYRNAPLFLVRWVLKWKLSRIESRMRDIDKSPPTDGVRLG